MSLILYNSLWRCVISQEKRFRLNLRKRWPPTRPMTQSSRGGGGDHVMSPQIVCIGSMHTAPLPAPIAALILLFHTR